MIAVMFGATRSGDVVDVIMITVVEVAATMIVVGITVGIGNVIKTVAREVIMIVGVMMTESGGTERCLKARNHYFLKVIFFVAIAICIVYFCFGVILSSPRLVNLLSGVKNEYACIMPDD